MRDPFRIYLEKIDDEQKFRYKYVARHLFMFYVYASSQARKHEIYTQRRMNDKKGSTYRINQTPIQL